MNIYIVVEGEVGVKKVYQHWVPLVNPNLNYVDHISLIVRNNFSILSGGRLKFTTDFFINIIKNLG